MGNVLSIQGLLDGALQHYQQALQLDPNLLAARYNLGRAWLVVGELARGQAELTQVIEQDPSDQLAHSTWLAARLYDPAVEPDHLAREHQHWAEIHLKDVEPVERSTEPWDGKRRLRIGYLSADFRQHAVAAFLEPVLEQHDRKRFEVFAYSDVTAPDERTTQFQTLCEHWCDVVALSHRELAQVIASDGIDVLVDLAGHTRQERLRVFAHRPAPVQITWLGYPCTTGLEQMDLRVVDHVTAPEGQDSPGSELLLRMPDCFCCWKPPENVPLREALPMEQSGKITFGSLHKLEKLNDQVLDVWCRIIHSVPDSRLLLCRHVLQGEVATRLAAKLKQRGLRDHQFDFQWAQPRSQQHLRLYDQIDVALDSWPWNGHTTACEALWMGVPVLTLRGNQHAARMVASVLTTLGMEDWIAATPEQYVALAQQKAQAHSELADLRRELRDRVLQSPLCDARQFTRELEHQLQQCLIRDNPPRER